MDIAYALSTFDYDSIFAANNKNLTKVSDPNYKQPQLTVIKDPANYSILPPAFQAAVEIEDEMIKKINQIKEDELNFEQQREMEQMKKTEKEIKNENNIINPEQPTKNEFPVMPVIALGALIGVIILFSMR
jgi:hypothetical protein